MSTDTCFPEKTINGRGGTISEWARVLSLMIENHRAYFPEEMRSDQEMMLSLLEYFVAKGVVAKRNEKYIVPRFANPQALYRQYSGHKN
jgi:hypothetical protein